ncbi:MAG: ABC transporter permease [Spirochaetales bacterium]|nr:ABC transporter permease [Spirochaetales bacterium]
MKLRVIAFRNILRNKRRSVLSGVAIAIVAMMITVLLSLYTGIGKDMKDNVFSYFTGHIRIRHNKYNENEELIPLQFGIDNYTAVMAGTENIDTVKAVAPRIQFGTALYGSPRLYINDIMDWDTFLSLLKSGDDPVFSFLREKYIYVRERLASLGTEIPGLAGVDAESDKIVLGDVLFGLNEALERYVVYNPERDAGITLSEETRRFTGRSVAFEERILFNRYFLEDAFPDLIMKNLREGKMIIGMGVGMDFERDRAFIDLGKRLQTGGLPPVGKEAKEMVLTAGLAEKLNATVGDRITMSTKTKYQGMNGITLIVTGIVKLPIAMFNARGFYLPIDTAQELLKMGNSVTDILVLLKSEGDIKKTVPLVNNVIGEAHLTDVEARPWTTIDMYPDYITLIDYIGYIMGMFFFLLGSTVIITTTMMVIYERMREIGTVAAMGMTGGQIVKLFFLESFYIGAIASFAGVLLGSVVAIVLGIVGLDWTKAFETMDFAMSGLLKPAWDIGLASIVFVYSTAVASIASFFPSWKAAKIQPVEALRAV